MEQDSRGGGAPPERPERPDERPRPVADGPGLGAVGGAGLQFALAILLFLYVGQWLDRRFGWTPWGTLVGVFVGAAAGFTSIYRMLMTQLRREEEAKRKP